MIKEFVVREDDILYFSDITNDKNPLHIDEEYSKKGRFGKRVAHGMLILSYAVSIIGNHYPGNGTILLSIQSNFKKPVYINDRVKIDISKNKKIKNNIYELTILCYNDNGEEVIDGKAIVLSNEVI